MNVHIVNLTRKGITLIGKLIGLMKIAERGFACKRTISNSRESTVILITNELEMCRDKRGVFEPLVLTGSTMYFPDNNLLRETQPWLFSVLINLPHRVGGKNRFTGGGGRGYLRIGRGV